MKLDAMSNWQFNWFCIFVIIILLGILSWNIYEDLSIVKGYKIIVIDRILEIRNTNNDVINIKYKNTLDKEIIKKKSIKGRT